MALRSKGTLQSVHSSDVFPCLGNDALPRHLNSTASNSGDIKDLSRLAIQGLKGMYVSERRLFCERVVETDLGYRACGVSPRNTAIALCGLAILANCKSDDGSFDIAAIERALIDDLRWINGVGEIGLVLLATSLACPEQLPFVYRKMDLLGALSRCRDFREGRTKELSWFLAGLSHSRIAEPGLAPEVADLAAETYQRLLQNQSEYGLLRHQDSRKSIGGLLWKTLGDFADQAHAIYAFSKFAEAFNIEEPLDAAMQCARALCAAQGEFGQWWWMYDSEKGSVARRYPVRSVHQGGIGAMSLLALGAAVGGSFDEPVCKGLQWIFGKNEIKTDLRNTAFHKVYDCLGRGQDISLRGVAFARLGVADRAVEAAKLRFSGVLSPDHCGWLLCAFGNFGLKI